MSQHEIEYTQLEYRRNAAAIIADTKVNRPSALHPYDIIQLANAIKLTLAQTDQEGIALLPDNMDIDIDINPVLEATNEFMGYDSPLTDGNIFYNGINFYIARRPTNSGITTISSYNRSKILTNIPYIFSVADRHIKYMEDNLSDSQYTDQIKAKRIINFQKSTNFWNVSKYMTNNATSLTKAKSAREIAKGAKTPTDKGTYDGRTIAQLLGNSGAICTNDTTLGSNDGSLRYYMRSYNELGGIAPIDRSLGTTFLNSILGLFKLEMYRQYQMSTGNPIPKACTQCPLKSQCNQLYSNLTGKRDAISTMEVVEFYNQIFDIIDKEKSAFIIL